MPDFAATPATAFAGERILAAGPLIDVAMAVKKAGEGAAILTFDDASGRVIDLDLRGSRAEIAARLAARASEPPRRSNRPPPPQAETTEPRGRGRPALGVVAHEVTLLPRHWEWLSAQPGGASAALRRLVDAARKSDEAGRVRTAREAAYRFMAAMAGDRPAFEEVSRALFAGDAERFEALTSAWPPDIAAYAARLAWKGWGG
ncbi:MAG: DUF2239 family protein [Bauldia sp.]